MLFTSVIAFIALFNGATGIITSPASVTGVIGQDINFKINTTNPILAIKFGIYGGNGLPSPLFLTVTIQHGVQCSDELDTTAAARFKGRVDFVGDIAKGRAWIRITNLTKDDSMVHYRISVREEQSTSKDYVSNTTQLFVEDIGDGSRAATLYSSTLALGKEKLRLSATAMHPLLNNEHVLISQGSIGFTSRNITTHVITTVHMNYYGFAASCRHFIVIKNNQIDISNCTCHTDVYPNELQVLGSKLLSVLQLFIGKRTIALACFPFVIGLLYVIRSCIL